MGALPWAAPAGVAMAAASDGLTREMWQAFEQAAHPDAGVSGASGGYGQHKRRRTSSPHGQAAAELAHNLDDYTIAPLQAKGNPVASAPARANLPGADAEVQGASPEITLQVCMRLLQGPAHSLQERPPHITEEVNPYMLFMESPKQKRTAGKWSGLQGGRIDRWANSGGVSGAHDYFPSAKPEACVGVRKR